MLFGTGTASTPRARGGRCESAGTTPAHMTAKMVIASAKRLIDVRQPCFSRSRIAEISVPAWPIPIHQTKLMIAKPQPTGMLMPQMPVPLISSQVTAIPSIADEHQADRQHDEPADRLPAGQDDRADLVGDRSERVSGLDERRGRVGSGFGIHQCSVREAAPPDVSSSGFGFRSAARYVVRGRVLRSSSSP